MSFASAVAVVETHLSTATSSRQFTVQGGDPGLPTKKTAYWAYASSAENELIPETLTDHPYSERLTIGFLWPVATRAGVPARALEVECQAVTRAFLGALQGDRKLGGNCEALTIGEFVGGWLTTDQWVRTVTGTIDLGFTDIEPIAE